jgi:phospholipid/cholesterol/gamma-HCH transport system substrate-binding protein
LTIVRKEAVRIRQGTIAKVANKGLLGDKLVELSIAPAESPALDPGARLASEEMTDLNKYLAKFEAIAQKTEQVVSNMDTATKGLADPQLAADIKATVASIRLLLDGVAHHQSVAHRLLMDDQDGQKVQAILNEAAGAATELRGAVGDVRAMTKQVRDGQGLAHTVLYDEGMGRSAAEVVGELGRAMKAVREGQGVAHSVIYGDETPSRALANLDAVTQDVRDMVAQMRAGKGTLGGLLMDPSVYEDIKSLVGNMNRNQVLRALVRYSIKTEEARAKGAAAEP